LVEGKMDGKAKNAGKNQRIAVRGRRGGGGGIGWRIMIFN
jgi:hypothetical protein